MKLAVGVLGIVVLAWTARDAEAQIKVTKARIGCLDLQTAGNLTDMVGNACNTKEACTFKAPTPREYQAAGIKARTRPMCTQAMEIVYHCGKNDFHTVTVPGDAWNQPPAQLSCAASRAPEPVSAKPDMVHVRAARIGCLDVQTTPNLTALVAASCEGKRTCKYSAPTEAAYKAAGVKAATRPFCTQAMEITYDCGRNDPRTAFVRGDAWNQPPAELACGVVPRPTRFKPGEGPIRITSARIGCLDIQTTGNLTKLVGTACNGRAECMYPAPSPEVYRKAGVTAATRNLCTQAMEITYRCGANDDQKLTVPGDAWKRPPAHLVCNGSTIATNRQDVTPPARGRGSEAQCKDPKLAGPEYWLPPSTMLDWTPTPKADLEKIFKHYVYHPDLFQFLSGFIPPPQPTVDRFPDTIEKLVKAPHSLGAHEGRLRAELRQVAGKRDALNALCQAAQRFTSNKAGTKDAPSDAVLGQAFADLSVTGRHAFAAFVAARPDDAKLAAHPACAGASKPAIARALDRAYAVANALRKPHTSAERRALKWVAVSGEDDQPYRPVNVPSTKFPQFDVTVDVAKFKFPVKTRYTIAHKRAPKFAPAPAPLVDGGRRKVAGDVRPAIAPDAEVIVFVHGMDSRAEEANALIDALHKLPGNRNYTVLAFDLPTSGYGENIHHAKIGNIKDVACKHTPLLDFLEEFVVSLVEKVDAETGGQLQGRIKLVVGGSLGGNLSMRIGRRKEKWIRGVVPWSPAAIWPSKIAQRNAVAAGCDTPWNMIDDRAVDVSLTWGGKDAFFLPENELAGLRRTLFYGGFDWAPAFGITEPPQAQCWLSDKFNCKQKALVGARLDRHETYDRFFRAWHWRLAAEQLAFSQQQFAPNTKTPLYKTNHKPMLLMCGHDDTCGKLCEHTRDVASKMTTTPGYARFMRQTGHSLDNEYPSFVAKEIATFILTLPR